MPSESASSEVDGVLDVHQEDMENQRNVKQSVNCISQDGETI